MEEANALVLQHLQSLNVRGDVAKLLEEELELVTRASPQKAAEASSLVQLVTRSESEVPSLAPPSPLRRGALALGEDSAEEGEECDAPDDEAEGRGLTALRCSSRASSKAASSKAICESSTQWEDEDEVDEDEEEEKEEEDDCSGDGGPMTPPGASVGLVAIPLERGCTASTTDSADTLAGSLRGDCTPPPRGGCSPLLRSPAPHRDRGLPLRRGTSLHSVLGEPATASHSAPPGFSTGQAAYRTNSCPLDLHKSITMLTPMRPEVSVPVTLHIYDLGASSSARFLNTVLTFFGTGVFHCGVEVYGREWSFQKCVEGTGVFSCRPRCCQGHSFSESVLMGQTVLPKCDVIRLIASLSKKWSGADYSALTRNCCHFCRELCRLLNVGSIPGKLTAAAAAGEYLETASLSYRSIILQRVRDKLCCDTVGSDDDVEDVPEAIPALALPSNTICPSQAVPPRVQQSLLDEFSRMSVARPATEAQT